jgi:DNA (cytosine-5)-methyltransferase 1
VTPVLLDLGCHAGGGARGYQRAGFHVIGVDRDPQPSYVGDEFVLGDALEVAPRIVASRRVDFIHASPHCQWATAYRRKGHGVGDGYVNQIPDFRAMLASLDVPYVIENVEQARPHLVEPVRLCGSMFGLDVQRHRLFESTIPLLQPACDHSVWTPRFPPATNRVNLRRTVEVGVWRIPLETQRAAMGIDWMSVAELSQAIPPAYTEHVGRQVLAAIQERAA